MPQRIESSDSCRYLHTRVHRNLIQSIHKPYFYGPKCPLMGVRKNKWGMCVEGGCGCVCVCIYTLDYYLTFKRKDILAHDLTLMSLENIMVSEICQSQKGKCCIIPLVRSSWVVKFIDTERRLCSFCTHQGRVMGGYCWKTTQLQLCKMEKIGG